MKNLLQEHDKQNEAYVSGKAATFSAGTGANKAKLASLANDRLNKLSGMIESVSDDGGDYVETLDTIVSLFDDVVLECAEITGRRDEIEGKIIELCKKIVANGKRDPENEHVTAKLIDALGAPPSKEISEKMAAALLDNSNPLRLGLSLYKNFCEKNSALADEASLDYLKTEAQARAGLINDDTAMALSALEKLNVSEINTPEKYLLISLNSFYHGFGADAARAIEIGLENFPGDERLLSAKGALV